MRSVIIGTLHKNRGREKRKEKRNLAVGEGGGKGKEKEEIDGQRRIHPLSRIREG